MAGTMNWAATFSALPTRHPGRMSGGNQLERVLFKGPWRMRCRRGVICVTICAAIPVTGAALAQSSNSVETDPCQVFQSSLVRPPHLEHGTPVVHELAAGSEDEYCVTLALGQHARLDIRPK